MELEYNGVKGYWYRYEHAAITTDCVIFGYDVKDSSLKVLLVERGIEPYKGRWALPGGFIRMDESADDAARRELREETSLSINYMEQFYTFSEPGRDPRERVITIAYYALTQIHDVEGGDDARVARWFDLDDMPPLAFDHDHILRKAQQCLRERIHFEPIGFELLPEKFTMRQLQSLYEAILSVKFDRRNFAKKMLHFGMLTQLDETTTAQMSSRSGTYLYSFNKLNYEELKRNGFRLEF